jgi:hypothetical protein
MRFSHFFIDRPPLFCRSSAIRQALDVAARASRDYAASGSVFSLPSHDLNQSGQLNDHVGGDRSRTTR